MGTDLVAIDRELTTRLPIFAQVLPKNVTPQRLARTVVMSCERLPQLLDCSMPSLMSAAMTAAVLGLECDGVTGQAYIIPFKQRATLVIGYKGYNTLGARSGYTITGSVVREGDLFEYELGSQGFVRHRPLLTGIKDRHIIGAWANAGSKGRPGIVAVMGIEELIAVKERSPGASKSDSPWRDPAIGFPAMCEKTVKRRLARSMPLSVMQIADAYETQLDLGRSAYIEPDGIKVVGEGSLAETAEGPIQRETIRDTQPDDIMSPVNPKAPRFPKDFAKLKDFYAYSQEYLRTATPEQALSWKSFYGDKLDDMANSQREDVRATFDELDAAYKKKVSQ